MKSGHLMRQVVNKINEVDFNSLADRQHFGDIYEQILNDLQSAGNAGEYYTPRAVTAFMVDRIDPRPGEQLFDPACGTGGFLTCSIRHMRDRYKKKPADEARLQGALRAVEKKQLPHMLCVTNMLLHGIENPSFVRHDNTLARPYISYGSTDRVDIILTNPPFGGREEDGIESNFPKHFQTRETADLFLALIIRLLRPGGRAAVVLPDGSLFGEGVKTRLKEHLLEECNLHTIVRLPNSVFKPYASIGTNLLFFEQPTGSRWTAEPGEQLAGRLTTRSGSPTLAPALTAVNLLNPPPRGPSTLLRRGGDPSTTLSPRNSTGYRMIRPARVLSFQRGPDYYFRVSTITAILEPDPDGTLHLPLPPDMPPGKVKVTITVEALSDTGEANTAASEGTPLEAFKTLRKKGGLKHLIPDPLAWQREQRVDRPLPGRE